jgi:hypothetical protein
VGEWVSAFGRHGFGHMRYPDGDEYDGEWLHDRRDGKGIYRWDDGHVYVGEWRKGRRNGRGFCESPTAGSYDGEWWDDLRHGPGTVNRMGVCFRGGSTAAFLSPPFFFLFWIPSFSLFRFFSLRLSHLPDIIFSLGRPNAGTYVEGKAEGYGTIDFRGNKYIGEWHEGLAHGWGTLWTAKGNR